LEGNPGSLIMDLGGMGCGFSRSVFAKMGPPGCGAKWIRVKLELLKLFSIYIV